MKLADWMALHGLTDDDLAQRLGVDRSSASRYRRGKQIPASTIMVKIAEVTEGEVRPDSFFDLVHLGTISQQPDEAA